MPIAQWGVGGRVGVYSTHLCGVNRAEGASRGRGTAAPQLQVVSPGLGPATANETPQPPNRIGVISNDQAAKAALRELLCAAVPRWTLDSYHSVPEALPAIRLAPPQALLLESTSGSNCEIDSAHALLDACADLPIAVLTHHAYAEAVLLTLKAGVRGYLIKPVRPQDYLDAIARILAGATALCQRAQDLLVDYLAQSDTAADWATRLTHREREIVDFVLRFLPRKEIADQLGISIHTVHIHLQNIFKKLHVRNRHELCRKCLLRE